MATLNKAGLDAITYRTNVADGPKPGWKPTASDYIYDVTALQETLRALATLSRAVLACPCLQDEERMGAGSCVDDVAALKAQLVRLGLGDEA